MLLYFGNHFLPTMAHSGMPILELIQNWQKQLPCSVGWLICAISAKDGTLSRNWHKPFSTSYSTFPIDPKLAETAPLFYRATDVPFLRKWNPPHPSSSYGTPNTQAPIRHIHITIEEGWEIKYWQLGAQRYSLLAAYLMATPFQQIHSCQMTGKGDGGGSCEQN